jgi:hypothetical protein
MAGWLVINEGKRIWNEAVMAQPRSYPDTCLEGLKKTTRPLPGLLVHPAKTQTNHLLDTDPKYSNYTNQLSQYVKN